MIYRMFICLLAATIPATAATNDWLPLAVGNSWTYYHHYANSEPETDTPETDTYSAYFTTDFMTQGPPDLVISILRTEVIEKNTYYVFSDIPDNWPPVSSLFIAGKKLRWDGDNLMHHTGTGEEVWYRFGSASKAVRDADVASMAGVSEIEAWVRNNERQHAYLLHIDLEQGTSGVRFSPGESMRTYRGDAYGAIDVDFLMGFGMSFFSESYMRDDYGVFHNQQHAKSVVIEGKTITLEQARAASVQSTSSSSPSWGRIKQENR